MERRSLIRPKARDPEEAAFLARLVAAVKADKAVVGCAPRWRMQESIEAYCNEHDYPVELANEAMRIGWPTNGGDGPQQIAQPKPVAEPKQEKRLPKRAETAGKHEQKFLFVWRDAFCSATSDLSKHERTVLLHYSRFADLDGDNMRPGSRRLAAESGYSRSFILKHRVAAENKGWIKSRPYYHPRGAFKGLVFAATIPPTHKQAHRE